MTSYQMFNRHRPLARALARDWTIPGYERQDVEQEATIGLWEASTLWRPDGGANFPTFARTVIGRHLADCLKAATRAKHGPLNQSERQTVGDLPHVHQVADVAEDRDRLARVLHAIDNHLTPMERHAIVGVASGRSYTEIGDPKQVDNTLVRARRKLRAAA